MKRVFGYFGTKLRMAPLYGPPRRTIVCEPFAGSAGYSVHYEPEKAILIDKNKYVVQAWDWYLGTSQSEIEKLPDYIFDLAELEYEIPKGCNCLLGFWMHPSDHTPRSKMPPLFRKVYEKDPEKGSLWSPKVKQNLIDGLPKVAKWEIIEGDYTQAPDIEAHWHVDPPYQAVGDAIPPLHKKL